MGRFDRNIALARSITQRHILSKRGVTLCYFQILKLQLGITIKEMIIKWQQHYNQNPKLHTTQTRDEDEFNKEKCKLPLSEQRLGWQSR